MITERYYAIRIGDPSRHSPYFMLDPGRIGTPWLFKSRSDAQSALQSNQLKSSRVVRVTIHDGACHSKGA